MSDAIATDTPSRVALRIHPDDDLGVALIDLPAGREIILDNQSVHLIESVRQKHKFALRSLSARSAVTLYGVVVGRVTEAVPAGGAIGTHNLVHATVDDGALAERRAWQPPCVERFENATFEGYHRPDGRVGTANLWLVVPLVFCENRNVEVLRQCVADALGEDPFRDYKRMARHMLHGAADPQPDTEITSRPFPNVDGVRFLTHTQGCGGTNDDARALCRLLAGYICHPNVAGATVLGLGCQKSEADMLREAISEYDPDGTRRVDFFEQQAIESEEKLIHDALASIFRGLEMANRLTRRPAPLSQLMIGLECGGSDGFSGISANPLVGETVDRLIALGGSAMLSEFPELCGVEHELMARCMDTTIAERFQTLMSAYQRHADAVGADFAMNPSPGNIRDGLITDAMKSAGAARKGGGSPIVDVVDYTRTPRRAGLSLLCTPGNDVESTTALAGSGANLILFTTGLGTPTGNPVAPVLKIASNTALAERMGDVIDFDAGPIVRGECEPGELANALLTLCIDTASGRYQSCAQRLSQHDFIPWKRGVSL